MRIQNNIMAMNTHRMYSINNANIAKSAEKLSSGYRINRAGDDAAGLAISEKMRSQIRGLGMASKNSQDAISLVQTAEGALQEVHTMLQRMNELAVQAATGTNQEFDRLQISKEFDQLKREINDISEQTTFNNMKILDGSLSNEGPVRSAATAGIYATVETPAAGIKGVTNGAATAAAVATVSGPVTTTGVAASFTLTFTAPDNAGAAAETLIIGDKTIDVSSYTAAMTAGAVADAVYSALGTQVTINGVAFAVSTGTAGTINFTATTEADFDVAVDVAAGITADGSVFVSAPTAAGTDGVTEVRDPDVTTTAGASATLNININGLKEGDVLDFDIAGTTSSVTLTSADIATVSDLAAAITSAIGAAGTATVSGNAITIAQPAAGAAVGDAIDVQYTPAATDSTTYIEFDSAKLRDGDTINIDITLGTQTTTYTYAWKEGDTIQDVFNGLGLPSDAVRKDNTITVQGSADVSGFAPRPLTEENYGTMRIQVGALEMEQLNIQVKSMNTAGLKLDGAVCTDQDTAGSAITSTRAAIDMVSDQRSLLGAMQNRLDHKISNLDNTAENLQAAEARIRDVDIAKEMTNFTKNNILAQAATAMLAQANAAPQSVLSLLQ